MDAWEMLVAGSTIESGDAWEHLQAQGGGGSVNYVVLTDGVEVEMGTSDIMVEVDQSSIEVVIDQQDIEVMVDQSPVEVEI